ncbi:MAG: hypothetical protein AAF352_08745 [Pseudomonadota bacterium]
MQSPQPPATDDHLQATLCVRRAFAYGKDNFRTILSIMQIPALLHAGIGMVLVLLSHLMTPNTDTVAIDLQQQAFACHLRLKIGNDVRCNYVPQQIVQFLDIAQVTGFAVGSSRQNAR